MNTSLSAILKVVLVWILIAPATLLAVTEVTLVDDSPSSGETIGNNWLLAIGIDEYLSWQHLETSVYDAKRFANVLLENYYFKEKCLIELYNKAATKSAILEKMGFLSKQLQPEDSLVIFFSGHGYINPSTQKGSWIPVDGDAISPKRWITNDEIIQLIQPDSIKAKHVLVIADSAFSADNLAEDPGGFANMSPETIEMAFDSPSRQIISSCYRLPVIQKGFPSNSVFTRSMIATFMENKERFLPISLCYNDLKMNIQNISGKEPLFKRPAVHGGKGEFVFILNTISDKNNPSLFLAARKKEEKILKANAQKQTGQKQWPSDELLAYPDDNNSFKKEFDKIAKESKSMPRTHPALQAETVIEPALIPAAVDIQPLPETANETYPETMIETTTIAEEPSAQHEAEAAIANITEPVASNNRFLQNRLGMTFLYVGPGSFTMGSSNGDSDEHPHQVTLTRGFYLQTTEVTQAQWTALMGNNPSGFPDCGRNCPVENVSWDDVQRFIQKLNTIENGPRYRLPTEEEWEYACRAGSTGDYPQNVSVTELSWFNRNSEKRPHPVASKQPNPWGFADMNGNVWEWCGSSYKPYPDTAVTDPEDTAGGYYKVHRGGSWDESAYVCRSANRMYNDPDFRRNDLGFRLVRIQ